MNESLFPDDTHEPEAVSQSSELPESSELSESSVTSDGPQKKRRRGSRGGRGRTRPAGAPVSAEDGDEFEDDEDFEDDDLEDVVDLEDDDHLEDGDFEDHITVDEPAELPGVALDFELPERMSEGRPDADVAEAALVQRPKIGDTRSSSVPATPPLSAQGPRGVTMPGGTRAGGPRPGERRAKGQVAAPKNSSEVAGETVENPGVGAAVEGSGTTAPAKKKRKRNNKGRGGADIRHNDRTDADVVERRRGRERNGRPLGRYFMAVQVRDDITQVAVMEGRSLIEHYVSRPADDESQIHGNIYVGKVQNILPGMEAAFVDIGTQKNAVLYRGDVQYDAEDIVDSEPRIEQILKWLRGQLIPRNRLFQRDEYWMLGTLLKTLSELTSPPFQMSNGIRGIFQLIGEIVRPAAVGINVEEILPQSRRDEKTRDGKILVMPFRQRFAVLLGKFLADRVVVRSWTKTFKIVYDNALAGSGWLFG